MRRAEALLNTKDKDKDKDKDKENVEPRAMRTASVLQQASVISQAVTDQREVFLKVRDSVVSLRSCIDQALESQLIEQHHGQHAHRATAEIGRLAKLHAQDAASLRASSELLRQDLADLQKQLASLDARTGEESGRSPGDERTAGGERTGPEEGRRRPELRRSSPNLAGLGRRSSSGLSSSQSLSPVPGPPLASERRGAAAPSDELRRWAGPAQPLQRKIPQGQRPQ